MADVPKTNEDAAIAAEFESDAAAIQHARKVAQTLGHTDAGSKISTVCVTNEDGVVVAQIPVQRRHS
jgi:hypothetical protein